MQVMQRRNFLKSAAALAALVALREEAIAAPGEIPRRTLGRTDQSVSIIGIGGAHIGKPSLSDQDSTRIIRTALDSGVNFLDNCWDYNDGNSERRMGLALQDGYRKKAFLMTKIDGRTPAAAPKQLEDSLRRLKTDHIDLMQIHEVIRPGDPEQAFRHGYVVDVLKQAQKASPATRVPRSTSA
jgi:aryl-alcohol dehydrogenase-like predicted oxidoreductase